jgi:hypothetical protein
MTFHWSVFGFGVLGGILAELLKWYQLREAEHPPAYLKRAFYWVLTIVMFLAGGVLAVVYNVDPSKWLLAMNIGISAPLILKALASVIPVKTPPPQTFAGKQKGAGLLDMIAGRTV